MTGRVRAEAAAFLLALGFLTRLPLPAAPGDMVASLRYLPAAGAVVGAAGAVVLLGAGSLLPAAPAVLVSIAATALLTGGLHEDGLADSADGLAGGSDRDRTLAIMRDSRIGAHGALALGLVLAMKATSLAAMPVGLAAAALIAGHAGSRLACLLVVATSRYARPAGTAGFTSAGIGAGGLAVAAGTAAVTLAGLLATAGAGAALAATAGLAAGPLLVGPLIQRRIGGYTGDTLGATQQLSEAGLYLGVAAWL